MKNIVLIISFFIALSSCHKKKEENIPNNTPQLLLSFKNSFSGTSLQLKDKYYINANGDSFTINTYSYYISNISFTTDDGKTFAEPESYHLINEATDTSKAFLIRDMPAGNYVKMTFLIGVDSLHNVSGAQSGALDPIHKMFWTWNTGYVMARLEGFCPQLNSYPNNVGLHIGGFSGANNALRWVTLQLPVAAKAATGKTPLIRINSDAAEWFKTPTTIGLYQYSVIVEPCPESKIIADNYADMFSIEAVEQ